MSRRIFIIVIIAGIFATPYSYYTYRTLKTRYIINDYFEQGRWEALRKEYDEVKGSRYRFVFFGDSMTENFKKHISGDSLVNMGISGDFTEGLIKRVSNVTHLAPDKIFIMIGINDIIEKVPMSEIKQNYVRVLDLLEEGCPAATIYLQSTLPTVGLRGLLSSSITHNREVIVLNQFLRQEAANREMIFVDMCKTFASEDNALRSELTVDGIHLNKRGYFLWKSIIKKYISTSN